MRFTKAERAKNKAEALKELRKILKVGSKVYVNVMSVSRSGMSRDLKLYAVVDNEIRNITWHACFACDEVPRESKLGDRVWRIGGCGMDMTFQAVYLLSGALFTQDEMPKQDCTRCDRNGDVVVGEHNEEHDLDDEQPRYHYVMKKCARCNGTKVIQQSPVYALNKENL